MGCGKMPQPRDPPVGLGLCRGCRRGDFWSEMHDILSAFPLALLHCFMAFKTSRAASCGKNKWAAAARGSGCRLGLSFCQLPGGFHLFEGGGVQAQAGVVEQALHDAEALFELGIGGAHHEFRVEAAHAC